MAAATTTRKRSSIALAMEEVAHLTDCPADRIEAYDLAGPRGSSQVVRCIDCGAAKVTNPDNEEAA